MKADTFRLTRRWIDRGGRIFLTIVITLGLFAGLPTPAQAADMGTISGTVSDADGHPLANIFVYANDYALDNGTVSATTNGTGQYTLTVPVGDYRVRACPGCGDPLAAYANEYASDDGAGTPYFDQAKRVSVTIAGTTENFSLQPGGSVMGTVHDQAGNAIQGITMAMLDDSGNWYDATPTEADGSYRLNGLPLGETVVYACADCQEPALPYVNVYYAATGNVVDRESASPVSVGTIAAPTVVNLSLTVGNRLEGKVTDTTTPTALPLEGVWVGALAAGSNEPFKSVLTHADGTYAISGLPDGSYSVQACPECSSKPYLTKYYNNTNYDNAARIPLSGGQTVTSIDFQLDPAALIRGKVTNQTTDNPVEFAQVYAEKTDTGEGAWASTDSSGNYTLIVPPGYYRLRTYTDWDGDLSNILVDEIYGGAANLEDATVLHAQAGTPLENIDFALEPGGVIEAAVLDAADHPLLDASVMAVPVDESGASARSFSSAYMLNDQYVVEGLPAGSYVLRATSPGKQARFINDQTGWDTGNVVTVTANQVTSNITFHLPDEPGEDPGVETLRQAQTIMGAYDPAYSSYVDQVKIIDQIFAGLTRIDPSDGTTLNNLVHDWSTSDYINWTFTLRDNLKWSDGSPLTAWDLRFGILRSLRLDRNDEISVDLQKIVGAKDYHDGKASASSVSITVDDATHISFALTQPISFFPTLLAMVSARPLPRLLAQAYPDHWLDPDKILTSGPYKLVEFDDGHALLKKNNAFYDQSGVKIPQVYIYNASLIEGWQLYLDGKVDTATIPSDKVAEVKADARLSQQFTVYQQQCTSFIGFTTEALGANQPANAALLRKALIEAIDRDAYNTVTNSGSPTAWTFIAPGVMGHSGPEANIHIPYNTAQAQADIQAAYNNHYTGLPALTIYYPTDAGNPASLKAGAEYLASVWNQTLNAHFNVAGITINEYTQKLVSNDMFAWRRGWCSDYQDGYNFLSGLVVMKDLFGTWDSAAFQNDLDTAAATAVQATRVDQYKAIEQDAIQTQALLMPVNYTITPMLSRGFVRSYGVGGVDYIADWDFDRSDSTTIGEAPTVAAMAASSASFSPTGELGAVSYTFPSGAFANGTVITHTGRLTGLMASLPAGLVNTSLYFTVQAQTAGQPAAPAADFSLTVQYSQAEIAANNLMETNLALYYWDSQQGKWVKDPNSAIDTVNNRISTHTQRLGEWAVLGPELNGTVYLPFLNR